MSLLLLRELVILGIILPFCKQFRFVLINMWLSEWCIVRRGGNLQLPAAGAYNVGIG